MPNSQVVRQQENPGQERTTTTFTGEGFTQALNELAIPFLNAMELARKQQRNRRQMGSLVPTIGAPDPNVAAPGGGLEGQFGPDPNMLALILERLRGI